MSETRFAGRKKYPRSRPIRTKKHPLALLSGLQKKFSERRGTIFFDSRLPEEKVVAILEHVVEGNGMRKTGRLVKVDSDTVSRYTRLAGEHAETLHDELVDFSPQYQRGAIRRKMGIRGEETKKLAHRGSEYLNTAQYRLAWFLGTLPPNPRDFLRHKREYAKGSRKWGEIAPGIFSSMP